MRPGTPCFCSTGAMTFCTAMAHSGALEEGFQMELSPHTVAIMAFQAHTATGKLKALMMPTMPRGCHCSYIR